MKPLTTIILTLLTLTSFGQDNNSVASTNYTFVSEPMPSYPGGHAEMIKFINKHLKYPTDSRTVQGKVYVEFIVNENGSLSDFKVVRGLGGSLDKSAIQTVRKMPNWIAAKRGDKAI